MGNDLGSVDLSQRAHLAMCLILLAMEITCRNLHFSFSSGLGYFRPRSLPIDRPPMGVHLNSSVLQFGEFELDVRNHRLRRSGSEQKLERIPMDLLILLASWPGELVRREEIIQELWGDDINVDTENAINTAIRKIRQALGDDTSSPRNVQTISKRGYRFLAEPIRPVARNSEWMEPDSSRVLRAVESGWTLVRFPIHSRWQDGFMGASRAFGPDRPRATGAHSADGRTNQFPRAGNEPVWTQALHGRSAATRRVGQVRRQVEAVRSVPQWRIRRIS